MGRIKTLTLVAALLALSVSPHATAGKPPGSTHVSGLAVKGSPSNRDILRINTDGFWEYEESAPPNEGQQIIANNIWSIAVGGVQFNCPSAATSYVNVGNSYTVTVPFPGKWVFAAIEAPTAISAGAVAAAVARCAIDHPIRRAGGLRKAQGQYDNGCDHQASH